MPLDHRRLSSLAASQLRCSTPHRLSILLISSAVHACIVERNLSGNSDSIKLVQVFIFSVGSMERTPREGHARDRSGWFWSRSGLSGLGRQVLVRTTEPEITNLPVFYLSDRLCSQVQTELDPHAMIVEFLKKLVDDIEEFAGQTFGREPDSAVYEELDVVDRCVWTLLLLQGELIPGLRHKCLMCKRTAEPILISLQRDQALMGVRVEGTVMKLSLMANRRDCDPPKLCGFHDFELMLALNAIIRLVPRHDIKSSGRHLSSQLVSWFLAKFVNPDIPLEI